MDIYRVGVLVLVGGWDLLVGSLIGKGMNCIFQSETMHNLAQSTHGDDILGYFQTFVTVMIVVGLQTFLTLLVIYELHSMLFSPSFVESSGMMGPFFVYSICYFQPSLWNNVNYLFLVASQWWAGLDNVQVKQN